MHQLVLLWLSVVLNIFLYFSVLHHLQVPVNWAVWVWSGYSCCACPFSHLYLVIWPWRQWGPTLTLILDVKQLNNPLLIINNFSCFRTIIAFPLSLPHVASILIVLFFRWLQVFASIFGLLLRWLHAFESILRMLLWWLHIPLVQKLFGWFFLTDISGNNMCVGGRPRGISWRLWWTLSLLLFLLVPFNDELWLFDCFKRSLFVFPLKIAFRSFACVNWSKSLICWWTRGLIFSRLSGLRSTWT